MKTRIFKLNTGGYLEHHPQANLLITAKFHY